MQSESRVSTLTQRIVKLSKDIDAVVINWETMGKPEPIMSPMNGEDCEDEATDEEIQRSLPKIKKPSSSLLKNHLLILREPQDEREGH